MLNYERSGNGRSVVLVHGITESLRSWDPLIGALAERFDVVSLDVRGHGASTTEPPFDVVTMTVDVHSLVESLRLDRPLMVGHSLGGTIVSAYAASYPCRGVVNVDQSLRLSDFVESLAPLVPLLRGSTEEFHIAMMLLLDSLRGALDDEQWRRINLSRRIDPDVVLAIWSVVFDTPPAELDALVVAMTSAVSVPYLSLHGVDPGADYEQWLTNLVPSATVELWDQDGHYPHLVEQARFIDRLVEFDALAT